MSYIDIIPIGEVEEALLLFLKQSIFQTFKIQTRIRNRRFNLSSIYDPGRNQYNASGLLLELINYTPPETFRILGVTELDLFIPIFTFLFGEAQLNGVAALVSTHRLRNQFYGIPEDKELLKNSSERGNPRIRTHLWSHSLLHLELCDEVFHLCRRH